MMWNPEHLKQQSGTLYQKIISLIERYIEQGILVAGERLPSERRLAHYLHVNRSTVIQAFNLLEERGILIKRQGHGTFINERKWGVLHSPSVQWRTPVKIESKPSLYKQKIEQIRRQNPLNKIRDLSNGDLPLELTPQLSLPQISQKELIQKERSIETQSSGILSLKESICRYMQTQFKMTPDPSEILITSGTQQSLFLITQGLLKPGDSIGIETPSYFYSLPLFQAAGLRIEPIECDEQGVTLKGLEKITEHKRLKWIFINPIFQNPTGKIMGARRKIEVLNFCRQHNIGIVEDDAYSAIYLEDKIDYSPIKKWDKHNQVIYLGSLSKYIGRHIRVGWMVAPQPIVERLATIREHIDSGLSILPQLLAEDYLTHHYKRHQAELREHCLKKRNEFAHWLDSHYAEQISYELPLGGFHFYLTTPPEKEPNQSIKHQWLLHSIFASEGENFGDLSHHLRVSYLHF